MKRIITLLIITLLLCCGVNILKSQSKADDINDTQTKNQIAYLFFKMSKNDSGVEKVSLEEMKLVKGKLKSKQIFDESAMKIGDLVITFINADGKTIEKQNVEDPLNPELETFGDTMSRHKVALKQAEFSIRYPYSEDIRSVQIEKVLEKGKKLLFTQNLQP